ncbi:MAG: T9SS type A sorting domain-containing protein [Flavobacteriales bacterium]|nr:T9SS type A sorting domain-containing protein [Flavobacteriales bacterium]
MNRILSTLTVTVLLAQSAFAWYDYGKSGLGNGGSNNSLQAKAANCSPAIATKFLEYNNVSALIETGGSMWQDRNNNRATYQVPKGSDEYLMYSGALWMGGKDVNNQLKVAALTFRQGNDFWTGPLTVIPGTGDISQGTKDYGSAEIEPDVCSEYDKFYLITRAEVEEFVSYWNCSQDPDCNAADEFPNYSVPTNITNWPAHGDVSRFQDFYLAPFKDVNGDQVYNPADGDYPWYDIDNEVDCRASRQVTLYGDYTMWWIFNDKGNVHTETQGDPIGMEIRAQAFAFATNDEINNMTFFNYELVNRSTQRLKDTYFAVWADPDIGCSDNDFIGCDVSRGVGYAYNGTNTDNQNNDPCTFPIGANPPAIGIDFFEGPYQDNDGIDNPLTTDIPTALAQLGIPYEGLGIGYGDNVVDNERLGMKRFTYFDRTLQQSIYGDPTVYNQYYNYMIGLWKDNTEFVWGGRGHTGTPGATNIPTNYCFPGGSDPYFWSTGGVVATPTEWSEQTNNNQVGDRRWVQAAGPFTLEPGALNNITVGVVYGKTNAGNAFNSVEIMLKADDKAQALFDNCFRILNGPNAPDLTAQELDQEVILYISNKQGSGAGTNYDSIPEDYEELDPIILSLGYSADSSKYKFQGYQIYQIKNEDVGPEELNNTEKARLVAQCDIKDGIGQMINFPVDPDLGFPVATEMVDGADEGIRHSFRITEDQFAQGTNKSLINHKKYYYMAIAYAHNYYKHYTLGGDGQQYPYLAGRKSASGAIQYITVIPHIPTPELGGTTQLVEYGYGPRITRVEGRGHADNVVFLTEESELDIVQNYTPKVITYEYAAGPIDVKVVDPLNVKGGSYTLKFIKEDGASLTTDAVTNAEWVLYRTNEGVTDSILSEKSITVGNEQIIADWGISVYIEQYSHTKLGSSSLSELLYHEMVHVDSSKRWLSTVGNADEQGPLNWITSGAVDESGDNDPTDCACSECSTFWNDRKGFDDNEVFESIIDGMWAPSGMVRTGDCEHMPFPSSFIQYVNWQDTKHSSSVDIVITSDKSKWTRVPVLETQDDKNLSWNGNTNKCSPKLMPSRDKNGKQSGDSGYDASTGDFNGAQPTGMSWFPGYAIDVTTGERLNMAFGEDSWLGNENGKDMLWNPTSRIYSQFGEVLFAGKHYIYIFKNLRKYASSQASFDSGLGAYDGGYNIYEKLVNNPNTTNLRETWRACTWVGYPALSETAEGVTDSNDPYSFIETDVKMHIRMTHTYERHADEPFRVKDAGTAGSGQNEWFPLYKFSMDDIATQLDDEVALDSACKLINVVPNPYYAYSNYEFDRLENIIKIVNLPDQCTIRIYNTSGTLVRTFKKDSPITSVEWDLKNHVGIPIASGMYLIHVEVPGACERVIKWLGVIRPVDLENF